MEKKVVKSGGIKRKFSGRMENVKERERSRPFQAERRRRF